MNKNKRVGFTSLIIKIRQGPTWPKNKKVILSIGHQGLFIISFPDRHLVCAQPNSCDYLRLY